MRSIAVIALLAIGCNEEEGSDQISQSGSRLQVLSYEMADGSRLVRGFWDSQTQEDCDVRHHADDGKLRCLPSLAYTVSSSFRTDTCVGDRVVIFPGKALATRSKFAVETDGFLYRVFRLGQPVGTVYQGTPGACAPMTINVDKETALALESELAGASFVEAFEQRNP